MSQSIFPVLRYRDPRGAIAFLRDVLGFEPTAVHPPEGDDVAHAELAFEGQHLMLGSEPAEGDSREYAVRDPEGQVWSVGDYRPSAAT